ALHLPLDYLAAERAAAVVGDPDGLHVDDAGLGIDVDLGDVGGEAVGGRSTDGAAAVVPVPVLGGVVGAHLAQQAVVGLGPGECLGDRQVALGVFAIDRHAVGEGHSAAGDLPSSGNRLAHLATKPLRRLQTRAADHER